MRKEVIPLKEELTPKQEKFIQNIVSGMSQRQAYKDAYNAENMKDETIDTEASLLFNDQKVSKRYKELMDKLEAEAIMTAQERMEWLTKVINGEIKEVATTFRTNEDGEVEKIENEFTSKLDTKLKALDTLNKMSGVYVTKVETTENGFTIKVDVEDE